MLDLRPILSITGRLLAMLAAGMLLPALVDGYAGDPDWQSFLGSAALTGFCAGGLMMAARSDDQRLTVRQAFVFTTASWTVLPAFAALPFVLSELNLTYTDAFFEAMSGLTTTGSTVIVGLDDAPPGLLLWRALLQWMGGIGIIVMAVAVLPNLQVGGMQLFRMESSDTSEKVLPRAGQIAAGIGAIYLGLTAVSALALWAAGAGPFEAVAHAMTTIATGGFSTSDRSVAVFENAAVEWIIVAFMILGSLPFVLYLQLVHGRSRPLLHDSQVRWFLAVVVAVVALMTVWQTATVDTELGPALRYATFNVVSIITGTGYTTVDYGLWGSFAVSTFFFLKFIGGCAGSTTCGIKIFRFQVLYQTTRVQMRRMLHPNGVFVARYGGRPLPDSVANSVMSFFFLFFLIFVLVAFALMALGLDFTTSLSGAATAIANVGPGLGDVIGPTGTFAPLPDAAKWLLSAAMLLGRLELLTVLVLFTPRFWQG